LQGLREEVADHLFGRTILDREFIGIDSVGDEVESAVEMFSSLAAGLATILFEEDCALVILIKDCVLVTIALRFEKIVGPEGGMVKSTIASTATLSLDQLLLIGHY
jgi:hypothetical protein